MPQPPTPHPRDPSTASVRDTPPALAEAPVLAHVIRSGVVESAHRATVAVTAPDATLRHSWGDPQDPVLPRSSLKPLQAVGMLRAGLVLPAPHVALACASHSGEPFHLEGVRAMLEAAGLAESDLRNTADLPYGEAERTAWVAAGRAPRPLAQNCSGKHAALLATCTANGWDTATCLDPQHPVQRAIVATVEDLTAEPIAATAVDGCGAPVFAVSLAGLARAFGRIATAGAGSPEGTVAQGIRSHPELLGGTGRHVSALIRGTAGAIAKDGSEAVYAVGLPDGRGVALKVADGGTRALPVILAAVLRHLGVESQAYPSLEDAPVLGHGAPVGSVVAVDLGGARR